MKIQIMYCLRIINILKIKKKTQNVWQIELFYPSLKFFTRERPESRREILSWTRPVFSGELLLNNK